MPGYPASHGCIRLPSAFAQRLWGLTKVSERVVIAPHEVTPSGFAHSRLPVPRMQLSPAMLADHTAAKVAEVATGSDAPASASAKLLNPLEYAQVLRAWAAAEVAAATKTLEEHAPRKEVTSDAIRKALSELRAAEAARSQAEARLAVRTEALATQRDARDIERAAAAKAAAQAELAEISKKLEVAVNNPTFETAQEGNEAFGAERELMEMRSSFAKAQAAAKKAERRLSPISVLVSKKDGKVYIRQALAPVLEAPITIRNPETLLGTHVYIATAHQSGSSLGWTVVSMPALSKGQDESGPRRPREPQAKSGRELALAANAAEALERIELPSEVLSLISERLWTGGSLIISDQSLSDETSDVGTDLVITMR